MPQNGGSEGKKRTKMAILCSKSLKSRVLKAWAPTVCAVELPTLPEMAVAWPGTQVLGAGNGCRLAGAGVGAGRELAGDWPGADAQTQNKNRKG